jgi:hypothetical protein
LSDKKRNITAKNLAEKPDNGGIPAKETKPRKTINVIKLPVLKSFKSLKVLIFFRSNKKKIKNKVVKTTK